MRNYLLHFIASVLIILSPFLMFVWWAEPTYGDLTRVGKWTEHDFAPHAPHPHLQVEASGRALVKADMMVLGDSFAAANLWQSVIAHDTGKAIKSFHYEQNCIANWIGAAISDPASNIVILETVERSFVARFRLLTSCSPSKITPLEVRAGTKEDIRPTWPPTMSLPYLTAMLRNTAALDVFHEKYSKRSLVVNTPIRAGCAQFSNRRNDQLLYYADDDLKRQWSAKEIRDAVANVATIQKEVEQGGKKFVFVVAPDKSTAYQHCILFDAHARNIPNIHESLINAGVHTPDLQSIFVARVNTIIDLYEPNNTHWSDAGFILAGEEIGHYLLKEK